jgi:hypothetical protein
MNNLSSNEETASNSAAKTERSLRRVWVKCTEAEETNRKLKKLKLARVGTNAIEAYSHSKARRDKWVNRGEEGRKQVVVDELESIVLDSDCKVKNIKIERKNQTLKFKKEVSHNIFRRKLAKILACYKLKRDNARVIHDDSVEWLKKKYGERMDKFVVPSEVDEFRSVRYSNPIQV